MELVTKSNPCGWSLVTLVSRGSSIIAEIQRLSQYIPEDFTFPKGQTIHPYSKILYDYEYFGQEIQIENMIEKDPELSELNDECRETHIEIVDRFCRLFESIVRYALDFLHYLEQVEQHFFLQMSIESILNETEGKQLLGEALYLYGVMLLQLDYHIPGLVRERLLVAFNRWRGSSMLLNYSKVCEVCRSSGYVRDQPYPPSYPLEFVNRLQFPPEFVNILIGRYRNDDVYLMMQNYPEAEHRSVALSSQSQMLFIFLFFSPDTLTNQDFIMREIVDKFFFDNWIVPYFMGYIIELPVIWKPFKSANLAITNTIKSNSMRYYQRNMDLMGELHRKIKAVLSDGFTKTEQLLDGINNFVKLARDSNVTLRFMILHTKERKSKKDVYVCPRDDLLAFLLDLAQFEFELKNALEQALETKPEFWNETRTNAVKMLNELSISFSGTLSLSSLQKDAKLQEWFSNMATEVNSLEIISSVGNVQKIYQLTNALEQILPYQQISGAIFIKETVAKVIESLKTLTRLLNIDEKYTPLLGTLSDFSYGFAAIHTFVPLMQRRIKADPFSVLKLRATFLKMTSLLDLQLVRIIQSESNDIESVSEHYSSLIVEFVRGVLEIVPVSIFDVLDEIIKLRTNIIKELPNRIERAQLKQYAQLEERAKLAALTKEISILTSGVLAMKTTLMGVITVDPKQMLEEGIRKQLVRKIIQVLYQCLCPQKQEAVTAGRFLQLIDSVGRALDGIRHSFEYMGDYVNIDGLRIWHHEYSRIMCFLVEQESNRFLKKKILGWQSEYQSKVAPIEIPKLTDPRFNTCIGSLTNNLMELTRHESAVYCGITGGWLIPTTGEEVLGTKTINRLCNAIGIEGTSSIDNLLSFTLAKQLKDFFERFEKCSFGNFSPLMNALLDKWPSPPASPEVYNELFGKLKPDSHGWTRMICGIGQTQLLKVTIDAHMMLKCKLEAESLEFMLENTNTTVLQAIKQFYRDPTHNPYPSSKLICALSTYLENCGICEPLEKIYTMSRPLPEVSLVLFGLTLLNLNNSKVREDERLHMLVRQDIYSHYEFVTGIITILRQMNANHLYAYLTFIGQYANLLLANPSGGKREMTGGVDVSRPLKYLMIFVKDFEILSKTPRRMVDTFIPPTIFDFLSI